jgi:3-carboxy-cis,cis-muconate cycloisomerase
MAFSPLDSALTGPFFADPAVAAIFDDRARLARYLRIEAALAEAQGHDDVAAALRAIDPAAFDAAAIGAGTADQAVASISFLAALREMLPEALAARVHGGATSQDLIDTEATLAAKEADAAIAAQWATALDGFVGLARQHRDVPMMGRTYNKHAAPITFGFKAAQWGVTLAEALEAAPAPVYRATLGGAVGTLAAMGKAAPMIARRFAEILDLDASPFPIHVSRVPFVAAGLRHAMALGAAAKIATDLLFLQADEVGEAAEPRVPGRGGSSAMPHKRNPVGCAAILATHMAAGGHAATLIQAMASAQERPAGAWQAEGLALGSLIGLASGAARELAAIASGLTIDPARMRENLDRSPNLAQQNPQAARWVEPACARIEAARNRLTTKA